MKRKDCKTIAFFSRKGGTGKTTLAVELMAFAANAGDRVLIIGCDQQEDITDLFLAGIAAYDPDNHYSLADVISGDCTADEAIITSFKYPSMQYTELTDGTVTRERIPHSSYTIDFMPAGHNISYITSDDLYFIEKSLAPLYDEYDWIAFDLPPTDSEISIYAFFATDYCIVPVTDRASFKSIRMVMDTISAVQSKGHDIKCLGALLNMDSNTKALKKANKQLFMESGEIMFQNTIRESADIPNSAAFSVPICSYSKTTAMEDCYKVYKEMLAKIEEVER